MIDIKLKEPVHLYEERILIISNAFQIEISLNEAHKLVSLLDGLLQDVQESWHDFAQRKVAHDIEVEREDVD